MHRLSSGCLSALLLAPVLALASTDHGPLHVPSPDWRDQVIYFLMIDRFDDGNPSNNDHGAGEYDPADHRKFSGGDLAGVQRRIDYIRGLGATTVWITPPVSNQWWDGELGYGGYHGYWAEHFMRVDPHYGTLDDYRSLSAALHRAGMYLLQDVVVNHTGNFFRYVGGWDPGDPGAHYRPNGASQPVAAPSQWPLSLNDPRDPAHREAAIYHWTPPIGDFTERRQELDFQLADLDDLNTESALVRRALRESYGYWIREVGVDGFRVDTAFHVPEAFFEDFMHAEDAEHPGMHAVARATGREGFLAFGEGFGIDKPYRQAQAEKLERYVRGPDGEPRLDGMINFPLYGSLGDVFARGRPSAELGHRIRSTMQVHADPHRMPSFVDNHDVERFLASGSEAGLRQALLAIMTLPGIPTLYYGTEQGFRQPRRAMFATGYGAGGRDHFDRQAPLYRYIAELTALRRSNRVLSRGVPRVLAENPAAPGALVYRMDGKGGTLYVAFNSADHPSLLDFVDPQLAAGARLHVHFSIDRDAAPAPIVGAGGRVLAELPARAGIVWSARRDDAAAAPSGEPVQIAPLPALVDADLSLHGDAPPGARFRLVVDGDLAAAQIVEADADGHWRAQVDTASMLDSDIVHTVQAWSGAPRLQSAVQRFRVQRRWTTLAEQDDADGDDRGPQGRYRYPLDAGWAQARPADIHRVVVAGSGGSLRIDVTLNALSAAWNPPNGFDRVALTLFVELPGRDGGVRVMPLQNAELPDGMRWHYRLRAGGWSNALFAADGADREREGRPVAPAASIAVEPASRTLRFTLPAAALGRPSTLRGARVYVTTWDYDGRYRDLQPEAGSHAFGGGDGARDPLIMDEVLVELR